MRPRDYQFCLCCYVGLPSDAKTLLCELCMDDVALGYGRTIHCSTHHREIDPKKVST